MRKGKKLRMSEDEMFWYRLFRDNHCLESRETGKVGAEMDGTSKRRLSISTVESPLTFLVVS